LLQAALELFAAKGYRATTMNDIGRAVGVTGPAIYRHFHGKDDLFQAVWHWAAGDLLNEAINRSRQLPADEAAVELLRAHAHMAAYRPQWVRLWLTESDTLPRDMARATRVQERLYDARWAAVVAELRPELTMEQQVDLVAVVRCTAMATAIRGGVQPPAAQEMMLIESGLAVLQGPRASATLRFVRKPAATPRVS
jgi:AcrR family transcriptional regulator